MMMINLLKKKIELPDYKIKFLTFSIISLGIIILELAIIPPYKENNKTKFEVTYSDKFQEKGFDGRLLLLISTNNNLEPRFQINDNHNTQQVFGINVNEWNSDQKIMINESAVGYPLQTLNELKEGEYYVQAFLHKYETFNLSTGHTVKLPMDQGEGQKWNISPKNLYSTTKKIKITKSGIVNINLDNEIPAIQPAEDTKFIKHIKIKSAMLSEFWGRDMYLQANVNKHVTK